jgi:hypothetical protein
MGSYYWLFLISLKIPFLKSCSRFQTMQSMNKLLLVLFFLMCLSNLTSSIGEVVKKINQNKKQNKNIKIIKNPTLSIKEVVVGNHIFNKLENAKKYQLQLFNQYGLQLVSDMIFVSFDVNEKYSKNWCFFLTRKDLYNYINKYRNCPLYEQINVAKHKLFFDIDINKGDEGFDTFNFNKYKECLEKELKNILNNKLDFIWLDSSSSIKHSYHLIVKNIACTIYQNEQIYKELNKRLRTNYLDYVYKSAQCLRLWGCSKYGQERPLKILNKGISFRDTLVNIYNGDIVEDICSNIHLEKDKVSNQIKSSYVVDNVSIPSNKYLNDNFIKSNQESVFYRENVCRCPICPSRRKPELGKKHKRIGCYVFNKGKNTYLGCFRGEQWGRDRHFLNLKTNKVEYLPKFNVNKEIENKLSTFNSYYHSSSWKVNILLNQKVTFGKYKGKTYRDLMSDKNYVMWILSVDFGLKDVLENINYLINNESTTIQPKKRSSTIGSMVSTKSIKSTVPRNPTVHDMVSTISKLTKTDSSIWNNMTKKELQMHYSLLKNKGYLE